MKMEYKIKKKQKQADSDSKINCKPLFNVLVFL